MTTSKLRINRKIKYTIFAAMFLVLLSSISMISSSALSNSNATGQSGPTDVGRSIQHPAEYLTPSLSAIGGLAKSSNVLVINPYDDPYYGGSAGYFPQSEVTAAGYTLSYLDASQVSGVSSFGNNDTIILWEYCTIGSDSTVQSALISFVQNGGKLIIWDSDACSSYDAADYSWLGTLGAAMSITTPGQTGDTGGSVLVVEHNNFLSGINSSNLADLTTDTDAVGDLNVITTTTPSWCATLNGTNTLSESGYAEAYSAPSSLTGAPDGMVIYTGFDTDYIGYGYAGSIVLLDILLNQLAHGWGPAGSPQVSDLTCAAPVGPNFIVSTNPINVTMTVSTSNR